jgi:hypothetical protein
LQCCMYMSTQSSSLEEEFDACCMPLSGLPSMNQGAATNTNNNCLDLEDSESTLDSFSSRNTCNQPPLQTATDAFQEQALQEFIKQIPAGQAVYQGPFTLSGKKHGEGEMIWANGDTFRGNFVKNERNGHGTLWFASGGEYVGEWVDNQMHGSGTRRFPNGDVYLGDYNQGQRHGQGRFYYTNGDLYWGEWKRDQINGAGRYYYASGQRFEGTLAPGGKRCGLGKLQRCDKSLEIFQYVNDQRVGQGVRWNASRSKAWRLWKPHHGMLERKRIPIARAVSLVCEMEVAASEATLNVL